MLRTLSRYVTGHHFSEDLEGPGCTPLVFSDIFLNTQRVSHGLTYLNSGFISGLPFLEKGTLHQVKWMHISPNVSIQLRKWLLLPFLSETLQYVYLP